MFSQTLLLNEYCPNLILDQRERAVYKTREVTLPLLEASHTNTSSFTQVYGPIPHEKRPKILLVWKFHRGPSLIIIYCYFLVINKIWQHSSAISISSRGSVVSGVTEVVVWLLFHLERFQKILLSDYSPVGSVFSLSCCILSALLTNVSTEFLWVDWELGCCSSWLSVWCDHFSQYSSHKGVSGQFVTEAGADTNSHLKGRDKAEVTLTWCIIDLSFKFYICQEFL